MMFEDSDHILSELSDSAFDLPTLEFEEEDVNLDEALVPSLAKNKRDILIEVNKHCKKVITLSDEEQDLKTLFRIVINNDPALRHYSYQPVTFQIFSEKFNTWVDLDYNNVAKLSDGTHLKAVFPKTVDRIKHSKHQKKSKKIFTSRNDCKRKTDKLSCFKRNKVLSDDEKEIHNSKRSRTSYSSDEGRSRVTTTVLDEQCNFPSRANDTQYNKLENCYVTPYKFCSVSSTVSVSSTSYAITSKQVKNEVNYKIVDEIEEGEMRDEDCEINGYAKEMKPASRGAVYRLSLGLEGKNPISALNELCQKMRCEPFFEVHEESNMPCPKFIMKVTVRGKTYIPDSHARTKKAAKKLAAEYCLKHMGVFEK